MKKLTFLLSLLALTSCTNNKAIDELLLQNNKYYELTLEEYELQEKVKESDAPHNYNKEFHQKVFKAIDAIAVLKDRKVYDTLYTAISILNCSSDAGKTVKPIQSDNTEILKNNLYLALMSVIKAYELQRPIGIGTHCMLSEKFKIKKSIENDSVKLKFWTYNPYQLELDAVFDGNKEIHDYKSDQEYVVWSIAYKPKSKESNCKGKIFFRDDYGSDFIMLQEFDVKVTK
jgi:hypothetical protein